MDSTCSLASRLVRAVLRRGGLALLLWPSCGRVPAVPPGYQGTVEFDQHVVSFEVAGRVERVDVRRGDRVTADQVIARLDDTIQSLTTDARRQDEKAAEADFALLAAGSRSEDISSLLDTARSAAANEALLRVDAARTRQLFSGGAVAESELDKSEAALQRATLDRKSLDQRVAALRGGARPQELAHAQALVAQAKAELALDQEMLARHTLRAELAGEVIDVAIKPGELAAVGTPAITLADTTHPYVDVFVPEGELAQVRTGSPVACRVDSSQLAFSGVVEYVYPEAEFTPKFLFSDRERPHLVVRVRVRLSDPDRRLHPGVPAFVELK
jgi:HlyD family secretion protein